MEGYTEEASPEEIVRSIEGILTKSRGKRRHRKTHGRISFGDLARAIADQWKTISPDTKAIFDHYAEVDMHRYKREVKVWRDKKEKESEEVSLAGAGSNKESNFMRAMNSSFSSVDSSDSDFNLDDLPVEKIHSDPWQPRKQSSNYDSFNSSFSSVDSRASDFSLEPLPIRNMIVQQQLMRRQEQQQQQQHQQQFGDSKPQYVSSNHSPMMPPYALPPGVQFGHSSLSSLQPMDSLLGVPSSHLSEYASGNMSGHGSGLSSSYASGLASGTSYATASTDPASSYSSGMHASIGLFPPSAVTEGMPPRRAAFFDPSSYDDLFSNEYAPDDGSSRGLENYMGNMDLGRGSNSGNRSNMDSSHGNNI